MESRGEEGWLEGREGGLKGRLDQGQWLVFDAQGMVGSGMEWRHSNTCGIGMDFEKGGREGGREGGRGEGERMQRRGEGGRRGGGGGGRGGGDSLLDGIRQDRGVQSEQGVVNKS